MKQVSDVFRCVVLMLAIVGTTRGKDAKPPGTNEMSGTAWQIGAPIITYWAGPGFISTPMTEASAQLLVEGGWNVAWCREKELDIVGKFGLRAQLNDPLLTPASHAAEYRLPFDGRWFVMAGGDTINVNHHMAERSQWFGIDFMKTGGLSNRAVAKGDGKSLDDYYSWGEPVLSPVDGVVRTIHDGEPDNPIGTRDKKNAFGNYVVIEAGPREFVYLAHFQKGSITAKEGDKITAGRILGKCGNSGNTDGPHIHMHIQSQSKPYTGTGHNIAFKGISVLLSGKQFEYVEWPLIQGLFVWQGVDR